MNKTYTTLVERKKHRRPVTRKYCFTLECLGRPTGCAELPILSSLDFEVKPAPASATGMASLTLRRMPSDMTTVIYEISSDIVDVDFDV